MDLFLEEINDILETESDKSRPAVGRKLIKKSREAIEGMKKHHDLMKYMLGIEVRQLEEIGELEKDCLESEAKVKVLADKRRELEREIDGLTSELTVAQEINPSKKKLLETR